MKRFLAGVLAVWTVVTASATPITVQELTTSPYEIITINVPGLYAGGAYAGIVKLLVDGKPMDGFCIDPYHFSSGSPLAYTEIPLASAPKPPGPMGDARALQIENLWTLNYSPSMTAEAAAGLQVAIWLTLKDLDPLRVVSFTGNTYGAEGMITAAQAYTGPHADLAGLTGPGQDYVVQRVPDAGTTLALLSLALGFIAIVRRTSQASVAS
jgi:hypothetical protein